MKKVQQPQIQNSQILLMLVDMLIGVILPALVLAVVLLSSVVKGSDCLCGPSCKCPIGVCPDKCQTPVNVFFQPQKPPQVVLPWGLGVLPPQAPKAPQNAFNAEGNVVLVTVESAGDGREKISWESITKDGKKTTNSALAPLGVKVEEKWAADVVKAVACADGKCPLVVKVKLQRKN